MAVHKDEYGTLPSAGVQHVRFELSSKDIEEGRRRIINGESPEKVAKDLEAQLNARGKK